MTTTPEVQTSKGEPSATEPWGWQLSGHHLVITCFILGEQMTLTPTFMGAEPRYVDEGKYAGIIAFEDEERLGLQFARNLTAEQKRKAVFSDTLVADRLPPGPTASWRCACARS